MTQEELLQILPPHLHKYVTMSHEERAQEVAKWHAHERRAKWEQAKAVCVEIMAAQQAGSYIDEAAQGWGIHPSTAKRLASLARVWRKPNYEESFRLYQAIYDLAKLELNILRPLRQAEWDRLMYHCELLYTTHISHPADGYIKTAADIEAMIKQLKDTGEEIEVIAELDESGTVLRLESVIDVDEHGRPYVTLPSGKRQPVNLKEVLEKNGVANTRVKLRITVMNNQADSARLDQVLAKAKQQEIAAGLGFETVEQMEATKDWTEDAVYTWAEGYGEAQ